MVQASLNYETKSQAELLLEFFKAGGSLTVLEALGEPFRCYALSQRCGELKRAGEPIDSKWIKLPSGKRVKRYFLEPENTSSRSFSERPD